jgi:hypothetical protein
MSAPRDSDEGLLADVAQVLFALLCLHPDTEDIRVPRAWLAAWYRDVTAVLEHLRHRSSPRGVCRRPRGDLMLSDRADLRMPAMAPQPDCPEDPYRTLITAILHRAVEDAQGHCWSPGPQTPDQIQAEARRWLQDEALVAGLVELCGLEPAPVLRRVRRILAADTERSRHS